VTLQAMSSLEMKIKSTEATVAEITAEKEHLVERMEQQAKEVTDNEHNASVTLAKVAAEKDGTIQTKDAQLLRIETKLWSGYY
jgi:predicted  nucleic acid-binding Zn-ribbon protein